MFRCTRVVVLAVAVVLGSVVLSIAKEPRAVSDKEITNSIGMKLMLIPAGEFRMGGDESPEQAAAVFNKIEDVDYLNADSFKDEHPQHRVRITQPFYMGTHEVTRGQFRRFIEDTGYKTEGERDGQMRASGWDSNDKSFRSDKKYSWRNVGFEQTDRHPVVNVSWNDATAFCQWLSHKEGKTYRLPTEAQWEYACRAGTKTRYYFGNDPEKLATFANVADKSAQGTLMESISTIKGTDGYVFTAPVGKFKPNTFGLYDMHGKSYHTKLTYAYNPHSGIAA